MSQLRQRVWVLFLKDGQEDTGNKNNTIKPAWQGSCFCYCEEGCWLQVTVSLLQFQNKVSLNSLSVTSHAALAMPWTRTLTYRLLLYAHEPRRETLSFSSSSHRKVCQLTAPAKRRGSSWCGLHPTSLCLPFKSHMLCPH